MHPDTAQRILLSALQPHTRRWKTICSFGCIFEIIFATKRPVRSSVGCAIAETGTSMHVGAEAWEWCNKMHTWKQTRPLQHPRVHNIEQTVGTTAQFLSFTPQLCAHEIKYVAERCVTCCTASGDTHASQTSSNKNRFIVMPWPPADCTCCCRLPQDFSPIPRGGTFLMRVNASVCIGLTATHRYANRSRPTLLQHKAPKITAR